MALFDLNNPSIVEGTSDEYQRTNTQLIKDNGDTPSGKKLIDKRLPKLFKFHFGGQMGWVVLPKGRIVSLDPNATRKCFDDNKFYNIVTIANGGADVSEANDDPDAESDTYTRTANKPIGVANQNVYQDLDDSFAGSRPGYVTRANVNVPLFLTQADAEQMEWGSAYGNDIKPGDRLKSDKNGRFIKWNANKILEKTETSADGTDMTLSFGQPLKPGIAVEDVTVLVGETEAPAASVDPLAGTVVVASTNLTTDDVVTVKAPALVSDPIEQIVGMVIRKDINLIPAGWLKWVMPESDYKEETGFSAADLADDGYPYDPSYMDPFATGEYRPTGIPGLTDGANYIKEYSGADAVELGTEINDSWTAGDIYTERIDERFLPIENLISLKVGNDDGDGWTDISEAASYTGDSSYTLDKENGLIRITLAADTVPTAGNKSKVVLEFTATHQMPGMPTHIDWDGVQGSLDILLQL